MIDDGFRLFPEQASTHAPRVDLLYISLLVMSAFFTVLIASLIVYFSIKYRRGNTGVDRADRHHSAMGLEIAWMVIPFVLSRGIFGWGAWLYFSSYRPPAGALEVPALAQHWMSK